MQRYKLISSDLDMTLLSADMTLSPENQRAISDLQKMGLCFVPNTGRTLCEIPASVTEHPDIRYIIYSNGAAIYDKKTDTTEGAYISKALFHTILDILDEYEAFTIVHDGGMSYVDAEKFNEECMAYHQMGKYYREFLYETNHPVKEFGAFCRRLEKVEMFCSFFHDDEQCKAFCACLEAIGGVSVVSSMAHNIEVLSSTAGKGEAMLRLAARLGITQAETMAVGDSKNDVEMIQKAGLGLAMQNAWQLLKEEADAVADCTNNEHVAKYILEKYFA